VSFRDFPIVTDPALAPGEIRLRTDTEQGIVPMAGEWARRAVLDPAWTEDCRSLLESAPFLIRFREASSPPIVCESCGTLIVAVPEARGDDPLPRRWVREIWEYQAGRKHTLRRCDSMRDEQPTLPAP
jgi:hypothetical protein